jgi:LacI family transcriptional regulator
MSKKTPRQKNSVTIIDVAEKAGVSVATVSRALSGRGYTSEAVREHVRDVARQINYRMNASARNLKVRRTNTIGLLITDVVNPFYSYLADGVLAYAKQFGYHVVLCATGEDPDQERDYLKVLMEQRVDGIIAVPTGQNDKLWHEVLDMKMQLVMVDREILGIVGVDTVVVDNIQGAFAAIEYLISLGHQKIGMISGSQSTMTGRHRLEGYYKAYREANLPVDPSLIQGNSYNRDSGELAIQTLLSLSEPPTAIFASSGILGEVALSFIRAKGLRIPNELSFIMFDDVPWAALSTPSITVVSQPIHSLGYMSLKVLHQRLQEVEDGEVHASMNIVMKPKLIVRESCLPLSRSQKTISTD